jgi:GntR family transcriptional regulator, transcriptional repressor for pyruvate dehydrogenase complex
VAAVNKSRPSSQPVRGSPPPIARFVPIHQLRAHEYVAEQIRSHIALRLIEPGESLPSERDLAATFGVGRPTIQHALRILEADGLVQARRGRHGGTFVCEQSQDGFAAEELIIRVMRHRTRLEELLVFRWIVEPQVALLAATSRRRADLNSMRGAIQGMSNANTEAEYMRYDTEFHLAIARATRNRFLIKAIEETRMALNDAMTLLPDSEAWHGRLSTEHQQLISAIESGAGDAAETTMKLHVDNSERSLRAVLTAVRRRRDRAARGSL